MRLEFEGRSATDLMSQMYDFLKEAGFIEFAPANIAAAPEGQPKDVPEETPVEEAKVAVAEDPPEETPVEEAKVAVAEDPPEEAPEEAPEDPAPEDDADEKSDDDDDDDDDDEGVLTNKDAKAKALDLLIVLYSSGGKRAEVKKLLAEYDVKKFTEVPEAQGHELLNAAKALEAA